MTFLLETIRLGLTSLRLRLLRSFLTALGIIFGVAAVITMVSIGEGSTQEALRQIERLGARNIILRSQKPPETNQQQGGQQRSFVNVYGLTREDLEVIESNFPDAESIVPVKAVGGQILRMDLAQTSQAFGTTPALKDVARLEVSRGRYLTQGDLDDQALVAVIGSEVARSMFPDVDPLGADLRIDDKTLTVIGVLTPVGLAGGRGTALIGRDLNLDIHLPITTARAVFGDTYMRRSSGSFEGNEVQISEIYLASPDRERVLADGERARRIINVRHADKPDVQIVVPYELLENARRSALMGMMISATIAGISLLVGGLGIMNIMLATVTERTREIGIRRAVGARRRDISWQFLVETSVLTALGGVLGVGLGVGLSVGLEALVPMLPKLPMLGKLVPEDVALPTQLTLWSILVAFGVATLTGLVFGIYPALKAAAQDPIVALRHE
ncbi:MAG: ABC transporter permease [Phycisphaerales bacterium]|jgi:putative ABC transport system permease protein|nr:ABC transporter permease [Phycisphaerales bacterium]